jgi:signal peptidase I
VRSEAEGTAVPGEPAGGEESTKKTAKGGKGQRSFWKELPILIVAALVLALLIKTFIVQAFYIPSGSMQNTLEIGDRILVNKIVYHTRSISRGDIVVFNGAGSWDGDETTTTAPSNPVSRVIHDVGTLIGIVPDQTDYIKRVVGLPGDRVSCAGPGRPVKVNGVPLSESSYIYRNAQTGVVEDPSQTAFNIVVPKGRLWVMGDHRDISADSRYHITDGYDGTIPENEVIGRAFVVVWPPSHWKFLDIPTTFNQAGLAVAGAALTAPPLALGFAGAVPLTLVVRRRRRKRAAAC